MVSIGKKKKVEGRRKRRLKFHRIVQILVSFAIILISFALYGVYKSYQIVKLHHENVKTREKRRQEQKERRVQEIEYWKRQAKRKKAELPRHCDGIVSPVSEIIIKGERHSGTKWIEGIISDNIFHAPRTHLPRNQKRKRRDDDDENNENDKENLPSNLLHHNDGDKVTIYRDSPNFGWKHGFLPPIGWGKPLGETELMIVVTRDVFTWLAKMYKVTYDEFMQEKSKELSFSDFIRTDYVAQCHPTPPKQLKRIMKARRGNMRPAIRIGNSRRSLHSRRIKKEPNHEYCKHLAGDKEDFDPWGVIAERAENIVQIRTQKYKQWLSNDPDEGTYSGSKEQFINNRILLKMEALTPDENNDSEETRIALQQQFVADPIRNHCVEMYDDFVATFSKGKFKATRSHQKKREKYDTSAETKRLMKMYSKSDILFVLSQIDLEFEHQLGYDYDYVNQILNSGVLGDVTTFLSDLTASFRFE